MWDGRDTLDRVGDIAKRCGVDDLQPHGPWSVRRSARAASPLDVATHLATTRLEGLQQCAALSARQDSLEAVLCVERIARVARLVLVEEVK